MAAASASAVPEEGIAIIAIIADKLNRPSDMLEAVKMIAKQHSELDAEQRKLFHTAYKNVFSPKFRALRIISAMEREEEDRIRLECIVFYRGVLEDDMQATCRDALDIVEKHLLPFCRDAENATLYNKMIGDTCWFLAMLKKVEDKEPFVQKALIAYETASKKAMSLSPAHPLGLSVYMTETAFHYDVMEWHVSAYDLTKRALEEARPALVLLDEESYKESTVYVKLMEENMEMWSTATSEDPEDELETASSSSTGYPCPEVPPSIPAATPDNFISRGDWEDDVLEGLSAIEIRRRKKAAQMRKGRMG